MKLPYFTDQFAKLNLQSELNKSDASAATIYKGTAPVYLKSFCDESKTPLNQAAIYPFRQSAQWEALKQQVGVLTNNLKLWCKENIGGLSESDLAQWDKFGERFLDPKVMFEQAAVIAYGDGKKILELMCLRLSAPESGNDNTKLALKNALQKGQLTVCDEGTVTNLVNLHRDIQQSGTQHFKGFVLKIIEQIAIEQMNLLSKEKRVYAGNEIHVSLLFINPLLNVLGLPLRKDVYTQGWINSRSASKKEQVLAQQELSEKQFRDTYTLDMWLSLYIKNEILPKLENCESENFSAFLDAFGEDDKAPLFFDPETDSLMKDEYLALKLKVTLYRRLVNSGNIKNCYSQIEGENSISYQVSVLDRSGEKPKFVLKNKTRKEVITLIRLPGDWLDSPVTLPDRNIVTARHLFFDETGQFDWETQQKPLWEAIKNSTVATATNENDFIFLAAKEKVWSVVEGIIANHPSELVSAQYRYELETLLLMANKAKQTDIVDMLVKQGVVDTRGCDYLCYCIKHTPDIFSMQVERNRLFRSIPDPTIPARGVYPIRLAARHKRWDIVAMIIDKHPERVAKKYKKLLHLIMGRAERAGEDWIVRKLRQEGHKKINLNDHLILEMQSGNSVEVRKLLSRPDFNPATKGRYGYPTTTAFNEKDWSTFKSILRKHGLIDPDYRRELENILSQVIQSEDLSDERRLSTFKRFLELGITPLEKINGEDYPIAIAARAEKWDLVKEILNWQKGLFLSESYQAELSCLLTQAAKDGHNKIIGKLLRQGIEPNQAIEADGIKKNALDFAIRNNDLSLVKQLWMSKAIAEDAQASITDSTSPEIKKIIRYGTTLNQLCEIFSAKLEGAKQEAFQGGMGQNYMKSIKQSFLSEIETGSATQKTSSAQKNIQGVFDKDSNRGLRLFAAVVVNFLAALVTLFPVLGWILGPGIFDQSFRKTGSAGLFFKTRSAGLFHCLQQDIKRETQALISPVS